MTIIANRNSLRFRVFRAGSWALTGHVGALALRLIGTIILTRIFAPDVFGILAVLTTISIVIALLTDVGLRQGVIRSSNGADQAFLNTAWTLQVLRGGAVWVFGCLVAIGLYSAGRWNLLSPDSVYATPNLPELISAIMFSSVILGFQSMKAVTASRDLNLKRVIWIELLSQAFHLITTVALGWATQSIWSYVVSGLLASSLTVLLSRIWLRGVRDSFAWDRGAIDELRHFGKWVFVSSAVGAAAMNGDRLLLAGWLNSTQLGYYSLASNLTSIAEGLAGRLFGAVALPALSEIGREQPERFSQLYLRLRWVVDSVLVGAAGFLFGAGPAIVSLLYDQRYLSAGWFLQWLSFGLLFVRYQLAQSAYIALGRPDYVTLLNVTRVVSLFLIVPTSFMLFGLTGAVIGIAFHMFPTSVVIIYLNSRHGLNNLRVELFMVPFWLSAWMLGIVASDLANMMMAFFSGSWVKG
jgi:O-antigen/teichoic acid export membrane protein